MKFGWNTRRNPLYCRLLWYWDELKLAVLQCWRIYDALVLNFRPNHLQTVLFCTCRFMERCDILRDARVVPQRGDNSCLLYSLSFWWYSAKYSRWHVRFCLREQICSYIRDNEDVVISISPDEQRTLSEAVGMDGFTCLSYCAKVLTHMEWGSVIRLLPLRKCFSLAFESMACFEEALFHVVGFIQVYWIWFEF